MPSTPDNLTDFIPVATLQRVMDSFTAVTGYRAAIHDTDGTLLAESDPVRAAAAPDLALEPTPAEHTPDGRPIAPVEVGGRRVGVMRLEDDGAANVSSVEAATPRQTLGSAEVGDGDSSSLATADGPITRHADAVRFLHLIADTIAQMCRQGIQLRDRLEEMSTLFELSTLLAGQRELRAVLDTVVRSVAEMMNVKASAIRLLDGERDLRIAAVYNLSARYLNKGPMLLDRSTLDQHALRGETIYVDDMATDPRMLYPEDARREGLSSILITGLIYRGKPIGVMRLYTARKRPFNETQRNLFQAVAQLAAAAIRNAQLDAERAVNEQAQRQVQLAAQVQRKLLPASCPDCPPFDVAGRYDPSFELGGDFYDFIPLQGSLGVLMGDVVGKGVPASLLMASVRASIRAHVQDTYDIDRVMAKVNASLTADTRDNEFATVFYGTLNRRTLRLTYCSAGHEPPLLMRNGDITTLTVGGMALGIDAGQSYSKGLIDTKPGDTLLMYTDGVTDALNFAGERFGRARLLQALRDTDGGSARETLNHVLWEVRRFVGLNAQSDDITLVAVKVGQPLK